MYLYKVYCGRDVPSAPGECRTITDEEVTNFLDTHVHPKFDGFTINHVSGAWKGKRERTVVLEFLVDVDFVVNIEHIPLDVQVVANTWKKLFDQDSVMVQMSPVLVHW
jgi:hypothetical protein